MTFGQSLMVLVDPGVRINEISSSAIVMNNSFCHHSCCLPHSAVL